MHKQWLDGPALIIRDLSHCNDRSQRSRTTVGTETGKGMGMGKKARGNQPGRLLAVDQVPPHV
jgi:hypothetical protein